MEIAWQPTKSTGTGMCFCRKKDFPKCSWNGDYEGEIVGRREEAYKDFLHCSRFCKVYEDFVNGSRFCKIYLNFIKSARNFQNVPICWKSTHSQGRWLWMRPQTLLLLLSSSFLFFFLTRAALLDREPRESRARRNVVVAVWRNLDKSSTASDWRWKCREFLCLVLKASIILFCYLSYLL